MMDVIGNEELHINYIKNIEKSSLKSFLSNQSKKLKNRSCYYQFPKNNVINHLNSLSFTDISNISTNCPLEMSSSNFHRIGSITNKKKKKIVTFKPNFNLVEKIFFDPTEPIVKINPETKYLIPNDIEKKKKIELEKIQIEENIEDKLNTNCTCLIF